VTHEILSLQTMYDDDDDDDDLQAPLLHIE
jgi:hypothetical protein